MSAQVVLVGEGHGAHAALEGLRRAFDRVELVTDDPELIGSGLPAVPDLALSDAPVAVLAGSARILDAEAIARRPVFNIHPSLLPTYRGRHSVVWAMLNDEPEVGITVHRIDAEIDNGPILDQHREAVREDDTSRTLFARLHEHTRATLGLVLRDHLAGDRPLVPQDRGAATWVPKRDADDCLIDFDGDNRRLSLFFRALVEPYPLPALRCRRGRFELLDHRLVPQDTGIPAPGRVVHVAGDGAYLKVRDGVLVVSALRDAAGQVHAARRILRVGERLG